MEITLQLAIEQLYSKAVVDGVSTSTKRLDELAQFCLQQLEKRGLLNAETDVDIQGGGRTKNWDIAWKHDGKYRLVISLKSILKNLGGTVPNRIDDMIGEVTNIQMFSPEIVVGYLIVFDVSNDKFSNKHGMSWCELMKSRLQKLSGRSAPAWGTGMIESYALIEVDFSIESKLITDETEVMNMFDELVLDVKNRNPSIIETHNGEDSHDS